MNIEVNYLAVLIAGIVSMGAGFLWYSPLLFAKPWMKLMGLTKESMRQTQKAMGKMYGLSFVLSLITGYVLFHVMVLSKSYFSYPSIQTGLTTAFWMWLGFVMPVQVTSVIFGGKDTGPDQWKLFAIKTGYQLASLLLMGLAIGLFMPE